MSTNFQYDPAAAATSIFRMGGAPSSRVKLTGESWAQGAMGALFAAEMLAAKAGIVPLVTLADGTQGIVNIGAARSVIDKAPADVRTIYLATHGAVRVTHAQAAPAQSSTALLPGGTELGFVPLVIPIVVVAVAAVIATAWYFKEKAEIEVAGQNLRTTSIAATIASLATQQLATTGKIDPALYAALGGLAGQEQNHALDSFLIPAAVGGAFVLGVGGLWWAHRNGKLSTL